MTETEALEVKKIGISEEDAEVNEESQIEASVGEHDVAALLEEAQNIKSDSKPEAASEESESSSSKTVEEKNAADAVANTNEIIPQPMEIDEESKAGDKVMERISDVELESIKEDSNPTIEPEEDIKSHIPEASNTSPVNVDSNVHNNESVENESKNDTSPSNIQEETILSTTQEETCNEPIEEDKNGNVSTETSQRSTTSPIPSKTMKLEPVSESNSTQSVLQEEEEPEAPQIQIPEDEDSEAQEAHTNDSFSELSETLLNHTTNPSTTNVLKSVVDTTINTLISSSESSIKMPITITSSSPSSQAISSSAAPSLNPHRIQGPGPQSNGSQGLPMLVKPPKTDVLLQTAKEVLQLRDEPPANVLLGPGGTLMEQGVMSGLLPASAATSLLTQAGQLTQAGGQRMSIEDSEAVQSMEFSDENATYILEPITNEVVYNDDPNIMWIQETVEVEQETGEMGGQNMIIILNPNGTINEELMLAHGINQDAIKAVTEAHGLVADDNDNAAPIKSLQHPIPQKELIDVKPMLTSSSIPRTIMDNVLTTSTAGVSTEHSRSVILDPKDNFLVLDDLGRDPMIEPLELPASLAQAGASHKIININGTNHIITSSPLGTNHIITSSPARPQPRITSQFIPGVQKQEQFIPAALLNNITPLGTLDLSLPKKPDPTVLDQFVNPGALVSETSVLKALAKPESGNIVTKDHITGKIIRTNGQKIRRPKTRDENGNGTPYIHRKTTSLGALGQALHGPLMGIPRDSRENAVQICPLCKFQATTKNPYRHLQDHLARNHFKDRIAADLPTKKPYICPMPGCDNKHYPDWQAVMRHYIGKKHGILDKFVKEELAQIRKENGGKIPGAVITPTIEVQL